MKMLMVCCDQGLDEKVVEALEALGASGYTVCAGAKGRGATGPKLDNPVWPGSNVVVHACVGDEIIPALVERVRAVRDDYLKRPGCRVFAVPVEQLL
jgi:Nitrogen regulatory protein P-II